MAISTSAQEFLSFLESLGERQILLVAEIDSRLLGYGLIKSYSDRPGYRVACETSIYLDRQETGRGIGTALQSALIEHCRKFEYHHVVTKIWASNSGSLRFHEKFGFELVGVQKQVGHLAGQWKDVAILQLLLHDVPPHRPEIR